MHSCSGGTSKTKDIWTSLWGDGYRINSEQCDDGNFNNGDGWSSACVVEPNFRCTGGSSTAKDTCTTICGDGFRLGTEQLLTVHFLTVRLIIFWTGSDIPETVESM